MTDNSTIRSRRSFIFTPGLRPSMYPKALASGVDMVCVQLEDGIAPTDKAAAWQKDLVFFAQPQPEHGVQRIFGFNAIPTRFALT